MRRFFAVTYNVFGVFGGFSSPITRRNLSPVSLFGSSQTTQRHGTLHLNDDTWKTDQNPLIAQHSARRGGNVLGLDRIQGNTLLWSIIGSMQTTEEYAIMREKSVAYVATLEDFAVS
jgi:hypothetical protein